MKNDKIAPARRKFETKDIAFPDDVWKKYYLLPYVCSYDTSLRYFQFRVLHRILPTNYFLKKISYVDSDACTFCRNTTETLEHLLYECKYVEAFWRQIMNWMTEKGMGFVLRTTKINIIFGILPTMQNKIVNWIILQAKKYIFDTKLRTNMPNFDIFKFILEYKFNIELMIQKNNLEEWKKWKRLFNR